MNKIYKVIWNRVRHCYVVVSEIAKNHGKEHSTNLCVSKRLVALTLAIGLSLSSYAFAAEGTQGTDSQIKKVDLGNGAAVAYDNTKGNLTIGDKTTVAEGANKNGQNNTTIGTQTDTLRNVTEGDTKKDGQPLDGSNTKLVDGEGKAHPLDLSTEAGGSTAVGYKNHNEGDRSTTIGNNAKITNKPVTYYVDKDGNKTASADNAAWYKDASGNPTKVPQVFRDADNKTTTTPQYIHTYTEKDATTGQTVTKTEITTDATKADQKDGQPVYNYQKSDNTPYLYSVTLYQAASNSIAAGTNVTAKGSNAVAVGYNSSADNSAVAIGDTAAAKENAVAIGKGTKASAEGSIALGKGSEADRSGGVTGWDPKTGMASIKTDVAWQSGEGALSIGNGGASRQITNVAAGSEDSDAVNLAQLKNAMTHYYSVKTTEATDAAGNNNYLNDGATGDNALAAGVNAKASGDNATAVGYNTSASGTNAAAFGSGSKVTDGGVAVGSGATASGGGVAFGSTGVTASSGGLAVGMYGTNASSNSAAFGLNNTTATNSSVAVGNDGTTARNSSVAVGKSTTATNSSVAVGANGTTANNSSFAAGFNSKAGTDGNDYYGNSVAVGSNTKADNGSSAFGINATADYQSLAIGLSGNSSSSASATHQSIAIGNNAQAGSNGQYAVALGNGATAPYAQTTAIGSGAQATLSNATALGSGAGAHGDSATALGHSASASANYSTALGTSASASYGNATALGYTANASNTYATAVGNNAGAHGDNATALGNGASANSEYDTAIGSGAATGGGNGTALGYNAKAQSPYATALGSGASASYQAIALGYNAKSNVTGGVALGSGSTAYRASGQAGLDTVSGSLSSSAEPAWKSTDGAISVGKFTRSDDGKTITVNGTRQIVGVAAGSEDTDAVNVAQLKAALRQTGTGTIHDYSVNSTNTTIDTNYNYDDDTGSNALAAGVSAKATGVRSVAVGNGAKAQGVDSIAIGTNAVATGQGAMVIGQYNTAEGQNSLAFGGGYNDANKRNKASSTAAVAFGEGSWAVSEGSVAFGYGTQAGNTIKDKNNVKYTGQNAVAFGNGTKALGGRSLAFGENTTANYNDSVAFGNDTRALSTGATAFGNRTRALSSYSTAWGNATVAADEESTAWGTDTIAGAKLDDNGAVTNIYTYKDNPDDKNEQEKTATEKMDVHGNLAYLRADGTTAGIKQMDIGGKTEKHDYVVLAGKDGNTYVRDYQGSLWKVNVAADGRVTVDTTAGKNGKVYNVNDKKKPSLATTTVNGTKVDITPDNVLTKAHEGSNGYNIDGYANATAFGYSTEASGDNATAFGNDTKAKASAATAFGTTTTASGDNATAFGLSTTASGKQTTAFGSSTTASGDNATAFGENSTASGEAATAFGIGSTASGKNSLAGLGGTASNENSIALGKDTKADNADSAVSVAIGQNAEASGAQSLAIGFGNVSETNQSGNKPYPVSATQAAAKGAIAIGINTGAKGEHSIAMGSYTDAAKDSSVAIGFDTHAVEDSSVAIGSGTKAAGRYSVALGLSSIAGTETNDEKNPLDGGGSVAMGYAASAEASRSVAIGTGATAADSQFTTAVGDSTIAQAEGSVAIGAGSIATRGAGNKESTASTDVNTGKTTITYGDEKKAYLKPDELSTDKTSTWVSTTGAVSVGGQATYKEYDDNGNLVKKTKLLTRQITNVAAGSDDTDAVNVAQLKAAQPTVTSNDHSVTIDTTTDKTDYHKNYDLKIATATLSPEKTTGDKPVETGKVTVTNPKISVTENGETKQVDNPNAYVTGNSVADAINNSGFKLTASASEGAVTGNKETLIHPGDIVTIDAGKNISLTQDKGKISIATKDNLNLGSADSKDDKQQDVPGTNGSITVNGRNGSSVAINGQDGSIGLTGPKGTDGTSTSIQMSTIMSDPTLDDGKNTKTTSGEGEQQTTTTQAPRIQYKNGKTTYEVATMDDGQKYGGDNYVAATDKAAEQNVITKKLNERLDIQGGADKDKLTEQNIGVNVKDGVMKVQLAQNLNLTGNGSVTMGNTIIDNGGVTITTKDGDKVTNTISLTDNGLNNGGKTITNVADGTNPTDAVNVSQLNAAKTTVTSNDHSVTIDTTTDSTDNHKNYDLKIATATLSQDKTTGDNPVETGKVTVSNPKISVTENGETKQVDNPNAYVTGNSVADAINNSGFTLTTSKSEGGSVSGTSTTLIKPGSTVTLNAGKNIALTQADSKVTIALSDDVTAQTITANGKNGNDGEIGLTGKNGADGTVTTIIKTIGKNGTDGKNGTPGVNGTDGITRIVYQDGKDGEAGTTTHTVATLDDGLKFIGDKTDDKAIAKKLGDILKIKGDGTYDAATQTNTSNIQTSVDGDAIKVALNKDINLKQDGSLTVGGNTQDGSKTVDDPIVIKHFDDKTLDMITGIGEDGKPISANKKAAAGDYATGLDNKDWNVNNPEYVSGRAATEDQLKAISDTIKSNADAAASQHTEITVNDKANPTSVSTENIGQDGYGNYAGTENDNLLIAAKKDATSNKVTYNIKLNDQLAIGQKGKPGVAGKDGKDGKVTVETKGGTTVVIGHDGEPGKDGKDGLFVTGKDGADGVSITGPNGQDGIDGKIAIGTPGKDAVSISGKNGIGHIGLTGQKGEDGKDGVFTDLSTTLGTATLDPAKNEQSKSADKVDADDKSSRIQYQTTVTDKNGKTKTVITHEVATMDDGLKFVGNDGKKVSKKLNSTLSLTGGITDATALQKASGKNIGVRSNAKGDGLEIVMTDTPDFTKVTVGEGDDTTKKITIGNQTVTGKKSDGTDGTAETGNYITGLDNTKWNKDNVVENRAATEGQLRDIASSITNQNQGGGFALTSDEKGTDKIVKQDLGKAIQIKGDTTYKADGNVEKAGNIKTSIDNGAIKVELNKDVDLTKEGSIKAGETTIHKDGVDTNKITIKDSSISISKDGINGGNKQITNVASGATEITKGADGKDIYKYDNETNAANIGDVKRIAGDMKTEINNNISNVTNKVDQIGQHVDNIQKDVTQLKTDVKADRTYQGDDGAAKKVKVKFGSFLSLTGGAKLADLTEEGNIGVVQKEIEDPDHKGEKIAGLSVRLAKHLNLEKTTYTSNENGQTYTSEIDGKGLTIKTGDENRNITVQDGNVNMGGNQIHNVAPGQAPGDAVNVSQLNATNYAVNKLGTRVNRVGAGAAALAALHPLDFDPDDKWDFAAGYGNYKDASAVAVGAYYRPNEDTMFNIGGSFGGGENMVNAGVSFKVGQGNHVSTSRVAMAKEIKDLRQNVANLNAIVNRQSALIDKLTGTNAGMIKDKGNDLFPDVPANHWAYEYVTKLKQAGILTGYPDGNFDGDRMMTRYEFAAIVYRAIMAGAASNPALNQDGTLDKLANEFSSEMKYIRIDTIAKDKNGKPTIERVRVIPDTQHDVQS